VGLFGFRSDKKRKAKIIDRLESAERPKESLLSVDLDDSFTEPSTSAVAQIKKLRFNFIDLSETLLSSLSPSSVFAIEIEEDCVIAAIASRKGAFLDIKHLKKYTYGELHAIYEGVLGKKVEFDSAWLHSFENLLVILTYDILYALPSDVILIDNRHSEFLKVTIPHSKFNDKSAAENMLKKQIRSVSGYDSDEIYTGIAERIVKSEKRGDETVYAVSMVEKEYYDEIEEYLKSSDFRFMRMYTLYALLYVSFGAEEMHTRLRVHVSGKSAYVVEKHKESGFDHMEFDLSEEYDSLLLMAYGAHEVILSGSGEYYEGLKEKLSNPDDDAAAYGDHKVTIRAFSYTADLPKSIIRLEREVSLEGCYATIISAAYLALFGQQFTPDVPGVSKHLTLYNYIHKNIKMLPFVILFVVLLMVYGTYLYLGNELETLKQTNSKTTKLASEQKSLEKNIKLLESNIKKSEDENKRLESLFGSRTVSEDAEILHEIAQKLPDDMILTKIEKKYLVSNLGKRRKAAGESTIVVAGKCFHEKSLLAYIKELQIRGKRVFLVSLKDDMKRIKKMEEEEASFEEMLLTSGGNTHPLPQLAQAGGVHESGIPQATGGDAAQTLNRAQKEVLRVSQRSMRNNGNLRVKRKEMYYSDTINNTFELEIK